MAEEVKHDIYNPDPNKEKEYVLAKFKETGSIQVSEYSLLPTLNWLIEEFDADTFKIAKTGYNVWTIEII